MLPETVSNVLLLMLNCCSTIGIVLVNKLLLTYFPNPWALTLCHQLVGVVILVARKCACRPQKKVSFLTDCWAGFLIVLCIWIQNLSLRLNSVPMYQIAKLMNIPLQCIYQYISQGKVFTIYVYASLAFLMFGVGLSTIAELDLKASVAGLAAAAAACFIVVLEQAEIARLKQKLEVDAVDFMLSSSLHRILMSAVIVGAVEQDGMQRVPEMKWWQWALLLASCLLATSINVTVVSIIGKFGPVTTAVVGHVKTCSIVAFGFLLHPPAVDFTLAKNLTGIVIALTATVKYGQYTACPEADCFARCRQPSEDTMLSTEKDTASGMWSKKKCIPLCISGIFALGYYLSSKSLPGSISMPSVSIR